MRRPKYHPLRRSETPCPLPNPLAERGIRGKLAQIVLRSLARPEHRYAQPNAMADVFDYRVRRPQRIRTGGIGLAVVFVMLCLSTVGWWRYEQLRYEARARRSRLAAAADRGYAVCRA